MGGGLWSRPLSTIDNGVRDDWSNWLFVTPTIYRAVLLSATCTVQIGAASAGNQPSNHMQDNHIRSYHINCLYSPSWYVYRLLQALVRISWIIPPRKHGMSKAIHFEFSEARQGTSNSSMTAHHTVVLF